MKYCILLAISILSFNSYSGSSYAWWLTEELELIDIAIDGIPISEIDEKFVKVGFPSIQSIPKNKTLGIDEIKKGNFKFRINGIFSKAPIAHTAVVGAYIDKYKNKGRFLLIYNNENKSISYLEKIDGKASFSFLYISNGTLHWTSCLYCGDVNPIIWKNEKFIRDDSHDWNY